MKGCWLLTTVPLPYKNDTRRKQSHNAQSDLAHSEGTKRSKNSHSSTLLRILSTVDQMNITKP
jgi:hypothetical protein